MVKVVCTILRCVVTSNSPQVACLRVCEEVIQQYIVELFCASQSIIGLGNVMTTSTQSKVRLENDLSYLQPFCLLYLIVTIEKIGVSYQQHLLSLCTTRHY